MILYILELEPDYIIKSVNTTIPPGSSG